MKVMLLTVTGGAGDFVIGPWRRIVAVHDEVEFLASIRKVLLDELTESLNYHNVTTIDSQHLKVLQSTKLRLTDTGLTEYPETPEEEAALFERMTIDGIHDNGPRPGLPGGPDVRLTPTQDAGDDQPAGGLAL